jgi:hypothetical protein
MKVEEDVGNLGKLQEDVGNLRKLAEDVGNLGKLQEDVGNLRKLAEDVGNLGKLEDFHCCLETTNSTNFNKNSAVQVSHLVLNPAMAQSKNVEYFLITRSPDDDDDSTKHEQCTKLFFVPSLPLLRRF